MRTRLKLLSAISLYFTNKKHIKNYQKCFSFHLKCSFHYQDNQVFIFFFLFNTGSFYVKSPHGPTGDTSDFIETKIIGCLFEENSIPKISASFFIWFKNYYSSNFAQNQPKLPSVRCKQDFPYFGVT